MKNFIVTIAIVLLYIFVIITYRDIFFDQRQNYSLKYITEELSASGSLFISNEKFSEGYIVFNDSESLKAINNQIKELMHLNNDLKPLNNSYWKDTIEYTVYLYDDSKKIRVYKNGTLIDEKTFNYPYLHKDNLTLYTEVITNPTVVVTINAGERRYTFNVFKNNGDMIRSSSHEWLIR